MLRNDPADRGTSGLGEKTSHKRALHISPLMLSSTLLSAQHRVIATEELFRGTLTQTSVYPREVVKASLKHNAAAVIFAHNHPSGVTEPNQSDRMLTDALKQALALVDVRVLDHFVVAGNQTMSFAERGII